MSKVVNGNLSFCNILYGIPVVLIGLYLIIIRFFVDAKQREKTYYALTNKKIIIISDSFVHNVKMLNLKKLSYISMSDKNNGRGTITFGPCHYISSRYMGLVYPGSQKYVAPAFEMIENVKQVYDLIRKTHREM